MHYKRCESSFAAAGEMRHVPSTVATFANAAAKISLLMLNSSHIGTVQRVFDLHDFDDSLCHIFSSSLLGTFIQSYRTVFIVLRLVVQSTTTVGCEASSSLQ